MQMVAPLGPVYQAGTLSGNPLAMTAGIETLKILSQTETYSQLEEKSSLLEKGIADAATKAGINIQVSRVGSILTAFFSEERVLNYELAKRTDTEIYGRFFQQMLMDGIYWPPSQFEAAFISAAHSDEDIQSTIERIGKALESKGLKTKKGEYYATRREIR